MKEITVEELKQMMDEKQAFQLIDVREQAEVDAANIGGEHIPVGQVFDNLDKISKEIPVIFQCRSGGRSGMVVDALEKRLGYTNVYNLKGGIHAWVDRIDPTMPKV